MVCFRDDSFHARPIACLSFDATRYASRHVPIAAFSRPPFLVWPIPFSAILNTFYGNQTTNWPYPPWVFGPCRILNIKPLLITRRRCLFVVILFVIYVALVHLRACVCVRVSVALLLKILFRAFVVWYNVPAGTCTICSISSCRTWYNFYVTGVAVRYQVHTCWTSHGTELTFRLKNGKKLMKRTNKSTMGKMPTAVVKSLQSIRNICICDGIYCMQE